MLVLSAHLCMAINLYKECRGASNLECRLVNRVVVNRMNTKHLDACSIVFEKYQFSWTRKTPKKLQFKNYREMIAYYKLYDSAQLMRAFDNVDKSLNEEELAEDEKHITYYYDRSLKQQPHWALRMKVAYRTKNFIFAKT